MCYLEKKYIKRQRTKATLQKGDIQAAIGLGNTFRYLGSRHKTLPLPLHSGQRVGL